MPDLFTFNKALTRIESFQSSNLGDNGDIALFKLALGIKNDVTREGSGVVGGGYKRAAAFLTAYRLVDIHQRILNPRPPKAALSDPPINMHEVIAGTPSLYNLMTLIPAR